VTRWFHAKDLRVADDVLLANGCAGSNGRDCGRTEVLPLNEITRVEVNDFSLGRTAGGIVLGTGAVVGSMMAEVAHLGLIEAITFGQLKVKSLGLVEGAVQAVTDEIGKRPPEDPVPSSTSDPDLDLIEHARPLFDRTAIRQDWIRLVAAAEIGSADINPLVPMSGLSATFRLRNIIEVGGGLRMAARPLEDGGLRLQYMPFFRVGLHLELDARRRFAIPCFLDMGGVSGEFHTRFAIGVRVRVSDRINLGLYPYNPILVSTSGGTTSTSRYAHATTLELGFAL